MIFRTQTSSTMITPLSLHNVRGKLECANIRWWEVHTQYFNLLFYHPAYLKVFPSLFSDSSSNFCSLSVNNFWVFFKFSRKLLTFVSSVVNWLFNCYKNKNARNLYHGRNKIQTVCCSLIRFMKKSVTSSNTAFRPASKIKLSILALSLSFSWFKAVHPLQIVLTLLIEMPKWKIIGNNDKIGLNLTA